MVDTLYLITETEKYDDIGNPCYEEVKRQVLVTEESVQQSEFYRAAQSGLTPAYKLKLFSADYGGEQLAEYRGERFTIYRTYCVGKKIELYLSRKAGYMADG